jgi:hypothetical protein
MKAKEFLDKKQKEHFNKFGVFADTNSKISEWMDEYSDHIVTKIFKESIDVDAFQGTHKFIKLIDFKNQIMKSIKK